ncbi:MAG: CBS domain-containing protein [Bacillota bacterium]
MDNAARFLDAFNRVEHLLRRMTGDGRGVPFGVLVDRASRTDTAVRRFRDDLKQFAQLRNAIVHETRNGRVIAEPNAWAVAEIERIASLLGDPPRVIPLFQKKVFALDTRESVARTVRAMREHSFSQLPVYDAGRFAGLLTTNTIVRWLGAQLAGGEPDLARTSLGEVLTHAEEPDVYCFLGPEATLFEVLEQFTAYERKGKRLEAVLITDDALPDGKLLGIITVWDLPRVYEILEEHEDQGWTAKNP